MGTSADTLFVLQEVLLDLVCRGSCLTDSLALSHDLRIADALIEATAIELGARLVIADPNK